MPRDTKTTPPAALGLRNAGLACYNNRDNARGIRPRARPKERRHGP